MDRIPAPTWRTWNLNKEKNGLSKCITHVEINKHYAIEGYNLAKVIKWLISNYKRLWNVKHYYSKEELENLLTDIESINLYDIKYNL